ncbi:MAG: HIT domain-containing protein [Candidatus Lokiarchaeota archaeon]|nr:HIT domain-containing protein [Candidatus Lokiarchaeota archaeon]
MDCILCKLAKKKLPVSIVYEDDVLMAAMDIQPINRGHVLVFPKKHASFLSELDPDTGGMMFKLGQKIAASLRKSEIKCEGVNFFLADGEAAFQEILHCHLHVFPRFKGDGFKLKFGRDYKNLPEREELDQIAEEIKKNV